uniref:Uncharacterized protein n=1 Tax=Anser cygnoides TaxID=8845 RepID=A0A8B9DXT7_ANSCY
MWCSRPLEKETKSCLHIQDRHPFLCLKKLVLPPDLSQSYFIMNHEVMFSFLFIWFSGVRVVWVVPGRHRQAEDAFQRMKKACYISGHFTV